MLGCQLPGVVRGLGANLDANQARCYGSCVPLVPRLQQEDKQAVACISRALGDAIELNRRRTAALEAMAVAHLGRSGRGEQGGEEGWGEPWPSMSRSSPSTAAIGG